MKRILTITLMLAMLLALTVPTFASEGTDIPIETDTTIGTEPNPDIPELPDVSESPETPETPDTPDVPETPDVPDIPDAPENPENPEVPDNPGVPETPNEAGTPDTPEQQVPTEETDGSLPEETPVINVSVPGNCRVIINPYKLEVELDGETHTEQIVSETCAMTNLSEVPVSVSVSASGMVYGQGDMMFVGDPPAKETYWKELFLYVEFLHELSGGTWSWQYTGAANQVPIAPEPYERLNVLELGSGETGFYRMFGAVTTYPELPWDIGDDFRVTLTFTFTQLPTEPEEFLDKLETSEFPELPETTNDPNIPEMSETPEFPELPEVPEPPETGEAPAEPEFPEDPAGGQQEAIGSDENEGEESLF